MIGSRPQVETRALVHLAGGPAEILADARDVLEDSATRIHHAGDYGTAATLKLIVNASLATQIATLAELLGVARYAGLDPAAVLDCLSGLPVTSPASTRAIGVMTEGDFTPNFPVRLVAKDLAYLATLAEELSSQTPMTRTALASYRQADATGHDDDLTAIASWPAHPGRPSPRLLTSRRGRGVGRWRSAEEAHGFRAGKVIYNCLLADRYPKDGRPVKGSLDNGWPEEIQRRVLANWTTAYGYASPGSPADDNVQGVEQ